MLSGSAFVVVGFACIKIVLSLVHGVSISDNTANASIQSQIPSDAPDVVSRRPQPRGTGGDRREDRVLRDVLGGVGIPEDAASDGSRELLVMNERFEGKGGCHGFSQS